MKVRNTIILVALWVMIGGTIAGFIITKEIRTNAEHQLHSIELVAVTGNKAILTEQKAMSDYNERVRSAERMRYLLGEPVVNVRVVP